MLKPTIHLGGTSPGQLLDDYGTALDALRKASLALVSACPNGRNYLGEGEIEQAMEEHRTRLRWVHAAMAQITELRDHCVGL